MNKLEFWFKKVECFEKISIDEAKELNKKMLEEENEQERINIRNNIVHGTLYNIYSFLKNSRLEILENGYYDMDDIISATIEYYISELDSGRFLRVQNFAQIFDTNYYTFLNNAFATQRENIEMNQVIGLDNFGEFMEVYLRLMENNTDISFEKYFESLKYYINYCTKRYFRDDYFESMKDYYRKCYETLKLIYLKLDLDDHDIAKTKLKFLRHLLMERSMIEQLTVYAVEQKNYEKEIIEKILIDNSMDYIFNKSALYDNEKEVLDVRFGISSGNSHTLEETVKLTSYNSRERVRQVESKALRKLRTENAKKNLYEL